jgi:hypothetical protein
MKKITFSADEDLIAGPVHRASSWEDPQLGLSGMATQYAGLSASALASESLMKRMSHVKAGRRFARDEMNVS